LRWRRKRHRLIHKNMSANAGGTGDGSQAFRVGVVKDPITVAPQMTVRQVREFTRAKRISGLPVIDGGEVSASSQPRSALRNPPTRRSPTSFAEGTL